MLNHYSIWENPTELKLHLFALPRYAIVRVGLCENRKLSSANFPTGLVEFCARVVCTSHMFIERSVASLYL